MLGSDSAPGDQRPRHRVDLAVYSVEWTKATNRHFAESLNAKGLSWYDDGGDARFHRVAGEWVADASAGQSPVVEATWFGTQEYCPWVGRRLSMESLVGRRAARSHPQAGDQNIGSRCAS